MWIWSSAAWRSCRPDLVIHRLTGDGPKDLLMAPLWSQAKRQVLNHIHRELKIRDTFQGRLCPFLADS